MAMAYNEAHKNATEVKRRWKDAEQEQNLLEKNFIELAKANIVFLNINTIMNDKCKAQEERVPNMDEKFCDIVFDIDVLERETKTRGFDKQSDICWKLNKRN